MTQSSANEKFLMENSLLISPGETGLEGFSSDSHNQPFHSTLLDDFQLDLELECEEDGTTIVVGEDITHSWNASMSPVQFCVPISNDSNEHSEDEQNSHNPHPTETVPTELIANYSNIIDLSENYKGEDTTRLISKKTSQYDSNVSSAAFMSGRSPKSHSQSRTVCESNDLCINCPLCQIPFSSFKSLRIHFFEQHSNIKTEEERHQCTVCGKGYCSRKNLKRHARIHSITKKEKSEMQRRFSCPSCSYISDKKKLLRLHIKNKHNQHREKFKCNLCSFSCIQERSLKVHILTHEGTEGKFACDQCGKLFFTMNILKRHARSHNASRPYVCEFSESCGKTFNIKSRLTDHVRTVHGHKHPSFQAMISNEKNESWSNQRMGSQLNGCNKMTENKSSSTQTEADIASDTPIPIIYDIILPDETLCLFSSSRVAHNGSFSDWNSGSNTQGKIIPSESSRTCEQGDLIVSQNRSKKFVCTWTGCGKRFRDGYNLRKHLCTHTGEMERACPLCSYQCIQKSAMDKHMKTHG